MSSNDMSAPTKFAVVAGLVIGTVAMIAIYGIGQAWILYKLWQWYMVAKFNAPSVSLGECYVFLVALRMAVGASDSESFKKDFWSKLAGNAAAWAILFGVAYWLR